ncbi:MAG: ABC transporter permease [Anaerolineae bacterium]
MSTLRLIGSHLRISIANDLQYRVNFFIQLLQSLTGLATGLIGIWLVFDHTSALGGWSENELLAVMGIYMAMAGITQAVIQPNMQRLMEEVRQGTLDYALTKPVDAQLLVSIREFRFWQLSNSALGFIVLAVAVSRMERSPDAVEVLAFVAALMLGAVMIYCFWLMLATTAFWLIASYELVNLFEGLYAAGRWPVTVYPGWLRLTLTFLVPVAFAVTVPAEALTRRLTPLALLSALALTAVFTLAARLVWKLGVRSYSGASS